MVALKSPEGSGTNILTIPDLRAQSNSAAHATVRCKLTCQAVLTQEDMRDL